MKKLISVFAVALVLVFSCVPAFADNSILTLTNLSDSRLIKSGNATVSSNGVVTVPAGGTYSAYVRVNPVSATRKYKFTYYYRCSSAVGSSFSLAGSVKIYYKDSSSNSELTVLELSKLTNADIQKSNTLTMPDNFGDAGRIYFVFKNTSASAVSIQINNFTVNDMTTADLDSSIDKGVDKIENAGSDSPPLDTDISAFQSAIDTMDGWIDQLNEFSDSIDSAGETAHEYISKGTELFNGFMGVAPASVIALIAFGVVFLVIRKIVGR
mgnify:CR=1 FL=1